MKQLLGCGLLVLAAAFSVQSFADDQDASCDANVQRLNDRVNSAATTDPTVKSLVEKDIASAKAAQAKGDTKECITITDRAKSRLDKYNK
ncbi:MAG: hypothetical protein PW845_04405 [Pseudomonas sp.]|uniref:hypothetical protein n=1 Tax=Pseudomonas abieticivorans TaxID=2931382 RepID=UPI0020BFE200|nr:hypothetical protein [Pseudomonas sp. PIA16]MDE1164627.1 hypothetical protein [Pseudomonas sp.]